MDLKEYKVDTEKENNGAWLQISDDCSLLIARLNNAAYRKELQRLRAPYQKLIRKKELSDEKQDEILNKAVSRTILLGWEGLTVDGKDYPYSPDNACALFDNPAYREFRDHVVMLASDIDNFREEEIKEEGKDSAPLSDGA